MKNSNIHFAGEWEGSQTLYLSWLADPEHVSETRIRIVRAINDNFLRCSYTWSHEGKPHEGELLIGIDPDTSEATGAWGDSWHQSRQIMFLKGEQTVSGNVEIAGTYKAPPDPDWSWRITIELVSKDELELRMFNISPKGAEELAVHGKYRRMK